MNLREYLFRKEMKVMDFGRVTGLSIGYISNIKNARSKNYKYPSLAVRKLIEFATEGAVNHRKDWRKRRLEDVNED